MNQIGYIKHIFLDVVGFTRNRTIESQTMIVSTLNKIVTVALKKKVKDFTPDVNVIAIPTGDGMCISLVDLHDPYDIEMELALTILGLTHAHRLGEKNEQLRFFVRVGISANYDNIVVDINGRKNIAGNGINMASRVMDFADANMILMTENVFEVLNNRDKYFNKFATYDAELKHGIEVKIYQYTADFPYLSSDVPKAFEMPFVPMPKEVKYYFALSLYFRDDLISLCDNFRRKNVGIVLLWFLSKDFMALEKQTEVKKAYTKMMFQDEFEHDIGLMFKYLEEMSPMLTNELASWISREKIRTFSYVVEDSEYLFVQKQTPFLVDFEAESKIVESRFSVAYETGLGK